MADFEFESRLDKMFAEPQAFDDAAAFAARVQSRLNRRWFTRGLVIGVLGGMGGLIGVGQIVGSGILARAGDLNGGSLHLAAEAVNRWTSAHVGTMGLPSGPVVLWLAVTAAGLGIAWAVTRLVEDL
jgi:hypothetical protein